MITTTEGFKDLAERLRGARASSGMSTRKVVDELPNEMALSHATIANYERGRTHPTMEVLLALAGVYGRPVEWFLQAAPPFTDVVFRNLKRKTSSNELEQFKSTAHKWLEAYLKLEQRLESPLSREVAFRSRGKSPVGLAMSLREHLGLAESDAVPSVIELLERFGIRAIELPTKLPLEGLAGRFGGEFAVVQNPSTTNDRCRMLAAHELGHFILGHRRKGHLSDERAEDDAYEFASHFLFPSAMLRQAFESRSILALVAFKQNFGLPLSAMMFRAERSRLIDKDSSRWLANQFSKRGWLKSEPGLVRPDRATRFERLLESARFDLRLRWPELESVTGISQEELENRRELALQVLLGRYAKDGHK